VPYDPTIYSGSARHYTVGRPPYSAELGSTLAAELGMDGHGRLLDVGCGPGVVAVELSGLFDEVVGLDPDAAMLSEAALRAERRGVANVSWVRGLAEDIGDLALGRFRLVTFGQSFHRTERERVAEAVYDLLEPGGAMVCIVHTVAGRPVPAGPDLPTIPHDEVEQLVKRYLGPRLRSGQGYVTWPPDRFEDALGRTRFGGARIVFAPGRPDVVRDVDSVVSGYLSMTWSAPHLYGDRLGAFEADLRALLWSHAPGGLFWDWPGDTELVMAEKPA
jgi:SAM-dependent methyltransferase